jgi:hypothetical protein
MHAVRALLIPEEYGLVRGLATTTDFLRQLLGGRELWPQTECGSARPNLGCQGQRHPTFGALANGGMVLLSDSPAARLHGRECVPQQITRVPLVRAPADEVEP